MVRRLQRRHWSTSKIALVACALPLTAIGGTALRGYTALETNLDDKLSYARGLNHAHRAIGEALEQMETTPAKRRVALLDVGSIGYHAPSWSVLDTFGLTNAEVALQGRGEPGYILAEQPSFIVFVSSHAKRLDLVFDHERPLLEASRQAGYRWKESLEFQPRYYLALFEYTPPPLGSSKIREEEAHQN